MYRLCRQATLPDGTDSRVSGRVARHHLGICSRKVTLSLTKGNYRIHLLAFVLAEARIQLSRHEARFKAW